MFKTRTIGRLFGVEVKLHGTFVLLLLFLVLSGLFRGGWADSVISLLLAALVFTVVVAHEYGHIFAARYYGLGTRDIVLTPIGGLARIHGTLRKPSHEIVIALAGPAVNLLFAGITFGAIYALPHLASMVAFIGGAEPLLALFLSWFLTINLVLCLFNLIPALPMDGGRVLRAALTPRLGAVRATRVAARLARWLALAMAVYGIFNGQWTLVFIALFVVVTSSLELLQAYARGMFGPGRPAHQTPGWSRDGKVHVVVDQEGRPVGVPFEEASGQVRQIRWVEPGEPRS